MNSTSDSVASDHDSLIISSPLSGDANPRPSHHGISERLAYLFLNPLSAASDKGTQR